MLSRDATTCNPSPPTASSAAERREYERAELEVDVDLFGDTNFYTGFSADISEGGIFVETYAQRAVGEQVRIRFSLPNDDQPIEAVTVVRWLRVRNDANDTHPGLGLRFVQIDPKDLARINAFVRESRAATFFDD